MCCIIDAFNAGTSALTSENVSTMIESLKEMGYYQLFRDKLVQRQRQRQRSDA